MEGCCIVFHTVEAGISTLTSQNGAVKPYFVFNYQIVACPEFSRLCYGLEISTAVAMLLRLRGNSLRLKGADLVLVNSRADGDELTIRAVSLEDVPAIVAIDAEVTGSTKADFWYGCYARQNTDAKCTFLVAHRDGEVAGYTIGAIQAWEFGSPPCGWVEVISVAPQHRNTHVATQLFEAVVRYFRDNGISTVRTMLHIDDHQLISFFRMQGMAAGPFIELEMQSD